MPGKSLNILLENAFNASNKLNITVSTLMMEQVIALALIPLAPTPRESSNELQAPMPAVILSGLLTHTALNMLVVPPMYLRF